MKKMYLSIAAVMFGITLMLWTPEVAQLQGTGVGAYVNAVSYVCPDGTDKCDAAKATLRPDGFPKLQVAVAVLGANGLHQPGLMDKDFALIEDGRAVVVTGVQITNTTAPVAVCLAIDISDSMGKNRNPATGNLFIEDAKKAAQDFVGNKLHQNNDRACLIAFGDKDIDLGTPMQFDPEQPDPNLKREFDFTKNSLELDQLKTRIGGLKPDTRRRTALYDAALKAIKVTASQQFHGARAVILFTDGKDERIGADGTTRLDGSVTTLDRLLAAAKEMRIPVFTIGIGADIDPTNLQRVAEASGASYQFAKTPDDLNKRFDAILTQLKTQYMVNYNSYLCRDGKNHTLQLRARTPGGDADTRANFMLALPPEPAVCLYYREGDERKELEYGTKLRGTITLAPQIASANPISLTLFLVQEKDAKEPKQICSNDRAPFTCELNTSNFPEGNRTIIVRAQDTSGRIGQASADVITQPLPIIDQLYLLPLWVKILLLVVPVLLLLALLIFIATRVRSAPPVYCPRGLHVMPPGATTCPFCESVTGVVTGGVALPPPPPIGVTETIEPATPGGAVPQMDTVSLKVRPVDIAFLVMERGTHPGKQFMLHGTDTSIGRAGTNDVVVDDPTVSRQQAKIKLEGKEYFLFDLATTNPCRVNGKEVKGRRRIVENDRIEMGNVVFVLKTVMGK